MSATWGGGQADQAFADDLLQQRLGACLYQLLGACTGEQRIEHEGHNHGEHAGAGQRRDRKLDRSEFHGNSRSLRYSLCPWHIGRQSPKHEPASQEKNASRWMARDAVAPGRGAGIEYGAVFKGESQWRSLTSSAALRCPCCWRDARRSTPPAAVRSASSASSTCSACCPSSRSARCTRSPTSRPFPRPRSRACWTRTARTPSASRPSPSG